MQFFLRAFGIQLFEHYQHNEFKNRALKIRASKALKEPWVYGGFGKELKNVKEEPIYMFGITFINEIYKMILIL